MGARHMNLLRTLGLLAVLPLCSIVGCGSGDESKVIQPTQDYQPTAEEKAMQQEMESSRESAK
jgi:hypothetical protein